MTDSNGILLVTLLAVGVVWSVLGQADPLSVDCDRVGSISVWLLEKLSNQNRALDVKQTTATATTTTTTTTTITPQSKTRNSQHKQKGIYKEKYKYKKKCAKTLTKTKQ